MPLMLRLGRISTLESLYVMLDSRYILGYRPAWAVRATYLEYAQTAAYCMSI